MKLEEVKLLNLPKILDKRGNLSFLESENHLPFEIKRVYWIYDVPGGEVRGGHAFKKQKEFIIALSGSLDVVVFDGLEEKTFSLNRSYYGLYIPQGYWRHMRNFSTNTQVLVASSTIFNNDDYIRNKEEYIKFIKDE